MKHYSAFAVAKQALSYHQGWERAWGNPEPKIGRASCRERVFPVV